MADLKYPIGKFSHAGPLTRDQRAACIAAIDELPRALRASVQGLSDAQMNSRYRPEGWTLCQVVHHMADSHINAYQRFKLALTEDHPTIKPYREALWAEEPDARALPVEVSLSLLEALHTRWVTRLTAMTDADFKRSLHHPDAGTMTLDLLLDLYAWHGRHHTAHVTSWRERNGV
jgi:uncharacterized damage-inducible protein DinB